MKSDIPNFDRLPVNVKAELYDIIGYHNESTSVSTSHTMERELFMIILPYLLLVYNNMDVIIFGNKVKVTIPKEQ